MMAFEVHHCFCFSLLLIAGKELYQFGKVTPDKTLPRIDDSPSTLFDVEFPFYGEMEKQLYVRGYDCCGR